jgi:hypothetical protein
MAGWTDGQLMFMERGREERINRWDKYKFINKI